MHLALFGAFHSGRTESKGSVPYDRNFRNFGLNEKHPVCVSMSVCMYRFEEVEYK